MLGGCARNVLYRILEEFRVCCSASSTPCLILWNSFESSAQQLLSKPDTLWKYLLTNDRATTLKYEVSLQKLVFSSSKKCLLPTFPLLLTIPIILIQRSKFAFLRNINPLILCVIIAHQMQTLRSCRETTWTALGFLRHQYLLFWLVQENLLSFHILCPAQNVSFIYWIFFRNLCATFFPYHMFYKNIASDICLTEYLSEVHKNLARSKRQVNASFSHSVVSGVWSRHIQSLHLVKLTDVINMPLCSNCPNSHICIPTMLLLLSVGIKRLNRVGFSWNSV
jgi:hypothetical protein